MTIKNETTKKLLRLANGNEGFKAELLGEMRRVNAPQDMAIDQESQQVLLTNLQAGDVIRFAFRAKEGVPAESETHVVLFGYDPSNRGVELSTEGTRRAMLEDRGQNEGVIYVPSQGRAYPLLEIKHVRSRI